MIIRQAEHGDLDPIRAVIEESSRKLATDYYSSALVDAALQTVLGVDTQLIEDGTYFVAEKAGQLAACGGWSWRRTLYGSDAIGVRDDGALDPKHDAARIRAFFVRPQYARQGIGTMILKHCESAAINAGFKTLELGATLSGVEFYSFHGYKPGEPHTYECAPGIHMEIVPMFKTIASSR